MTMKSESLFSVIIPTKDRAEFLHHTLRTCSLQDDENLEFIVSDDGSRDNTKDVVLEAARKDPRIRYVTPGPGVGMRDNFEFALDQVKPGYVMALGGDDGLLPYGIRGMREVLKDTGQEMLAWHAPIFYYAKARMETGQLVLPRPRPGRILQSKDYLERQARTLDYISDPESPMFYVKGVTSTRLVDRVRSRSVDGRFYQCPTPDGYSGIVLAGEVETYAFSGEPFSIYGASPTAQGVSYLAGDNEARKRSEAFFRDVAQVPMHGELASQPYSPLITIMTVDYLLTARDLQGWPGRFPAIDFRQLLLKSLGELAHGLYSEERVARELGILNQIAEQHGLGAFFRQTVKDSRRHQKKTPFEGNGFTPNQLFLDCSMYGIKDIFDAAFVAHYTSRLAQKTNLSTLWDTIVRTVGYRLRSLRKGGAFPSQAEWVDTDKSQAKG